MFWFSQLLAFLTNKEFVFFFQLRNIGEKIRRFVFKKFVKTCREFDNSPGRLETLHRRCSGCRNSLPRMHLWSHSWYQQYFQSWLVLLINKYVGKIPQLILWTHRLYCVFLLCLASFDFYRVAVLFSSGSVQAILQHIDFMDTALFSAN